MVALYRKYTRALTYEGGECEQSAEAKQSQARPASRWPGSLSSEVSWGSLTNP
jgi:hypothetical protein